MIACPLCGKSFRKTNNLPPPLLWKHINSCHVCRGELPQSDFIIDNNRLVCSASNCHWIYHQRLRRAGCQRPLGNGRKCGGTLKSPVDLLDLAFARSKITRVEVLLEYEQNPSMPSMPNSSDLCDEDLLSPMLEGDLVNQLVLM